MKTNRRNFLKYTAATGAVLTTPTVFGLSKDRPIIPYGVQSGDVLNDRAIIWSRADRPARMIVEWSTSESFDNVKRVMGPNAMPETDFTASVDLQGLPTGEQIYYRVKFADLAHLSSESEPTVGQLRTAPAEKRDITFQWSGDTAGQGWGINEEWGGMKIYKKMAESNPDFFIHCGDTVYADGPIKAEVKLEDGSIWKNVTTEAKSKVAESLDEFRGNYIYNLLDKNVREFNAKVPMISQWDDHETVNNWYPNETLEDDRYSVKSVALLSARAKQAFMEYMPMRKSNNERERIYRKVPYGPSLDMFVIDMRSYRADNSANRQENAGEDTTFMGSSQIEWLKEGLKASKAVWKVIASDMPIGLLVRDGDNFENGANGDGPVLGREHEIADLLKFIKDEGIKNVVWFTADVHYTAAHYYDPEQAQFQEFDGFWEFVSGPLNAGTFGPNDLDNTFGPQVKYVKAPEKGQANLPPSAGMQFFGEVKIKGDTDVMTVMLKDLEGETLYSVDLEPKA